MEIFDFIGAKLADFLTYTGFACAEWGNWGMILLHTAVYAAVAVVALEFVDKDKR